LIRPDAPSGRDGSGPTGRAPPSLSRARVRPPAASCGLGASSGPRSSRCLNPRGWTLLFAGVRFGRSAPRASSVPRPRRVSTGNRALGSRLRGDVSRRPGCGPCARRLWGGAGRAFTRCVPSSDASLSSHGTGASAPSPTASSGPRVPLWDTWSPFHRRDQNRSTVPSLEEPSPRSREDGGTTRGAFRRIGVTACLRRSTRRFIRAHPTPLGAGQSRDPCLPCDVLAMCRWHPFARAPVRPGASAAKPSRTSRPATLHRPSPRVLWWRRATVPRVSGRTVCDGLARPPARCLAAARGARARCSRPTSASHCFDDEHPRLVGSQHLFEACASPHRSRLAP